MTPADSEQADDRQLLSGALTCRGCIHYQVTWDAKLPYGCRALSFKSAQSPALVVYQASGIRCQLYTPRK